MTGRSNIVILGFCFIALFFQATQSYGLAAEPERISIDELKDLIDSKADIVIIDVRQENNYDTGHLPNAISVPFPDGIDAKHDELPKDKLLILYCS